MGDLFADAGTLRPGPCTGLTAAWCPVHGRCTCNPPGLPLNDACPLHGADSDHDR